MGSKFVTSAFSNKEVSIITKSYSKMYPDYSEDIASGRITIPSSFKLFSVLLYKSNRIRASTQNRSNYVLASPMFPFVTSNLSEFEGSKRVVKLYYFLEHSISLNTEHTITNQFAAVSWPMVHPKRFHFGKPVEVWCNELYEPNTDNNFLPLSRISERVMIGVDKVEEENVLIVIPIIAPCSPWPNACKKSEDSNVGKHPHT